MPPARSIVLTSLALAMLLQGCSVVPPVTGDKAADPAKVAPAAPAPDGTAGEVPEFNLNLSATDNCACGPAPDKDYTFFEKGYRSLLDGEYDDAMQHFQRYQRLEASPRADLEAGIAIAYIRMLPRSSFYDPQAARDSFRVLREQNAKRRQVHESTRLMRQALLNLLELQKKIDELKARNATLKDDVQKREEALKRLRDLTLNQNQQGAAQ